MADNLKQKIIPVDIESEMRKSFIDYAMSVIVDRALPDVRDGLKPVHRRILYSMLTQGFTPDKSYRKCATTVGDVLGRFHPHGDSAVYESLVRMSQEWSLRYPLIDGHGNFGSIDGDPPAAYRYTESKLEKISMQILRDINKETVDFKPNFDEHEMEPVVMPSRFPNLLVNGSVGIAVGMATNIPPHNLVEVIDGIIKVIDMPEITIDEISAIIKGPDFPTAATIVGRRGIREAYRTGRGRIVVRAVTEIEEFGQNRHRIIVKELPYQVNKARLVEKIASLVKDKRIDKISDLRDESDRTGMRIVIELKRDVSADVVLNQLYKNTQLQETFWVNMIALVPVENKFEPRLLNLRQAIDYYIDHQKEIITRRTIFELKKAEARAHILEGLKIAVDNLDEVIKIIRNSKTENMAKEKLIEVFSLSIKQSQAIVDMRLGRLTGLEIEKLENEYNELMKRIQHLKDVLANEKLILDVVKEELIEIKGKFGDERRTSIIAEEGEIDIEDLIEEKDVVITMTHYGYIKRLPIDTYKSQKRGGKGVAGLSTRESDFVENIYTTSTHNYMMFFTNLGKVYRLKAYQIPEAGRQAKGTAIVNLLSLEPGEKVTTIIPVRDFKKGLYLLMATKNGMVKKTSLTEYENNRRLGLIAVNLKENDELISVKLTDGTKDIMLVTRNGLSIRFNESEVRPLSRKSIGVMGIRMSEEDYVITMASYIENASLLIVTENGYGKRTNLSEYRKQGRNGRGIIAHKVTEKTGKIADVKLVNEIDDILLISSDGTIIRVKVSEISIIGRNTQGLILMRLNEKDTVVSIARIENDEETENSEDELNEEEINKELVANEEKINEVEVVNEEETDEDKEN
jgi:DNA gyrase subunit A